VYNLLWHFVNYCPHTTVLHRCLLRESHGQFPKVIPTGSKDNVYMVVDNVDNVTRRLNGLHSNFPDDCGVWQSSKASTTSVPYLVVGQHLGRRLYFRNGKYCRERRRATVRFYEPLDPQPMDSDVVRLISYYSTLAADPTYKRRITWIAGAEVQIAVVEYEGKFPGRIAHGTPSTLTSTTLEQDQQPCGLWRALCLVKLRNRCMRKCL
jgi:hypothetical protein